MTGTDGRHDDLLTLRLPRTAARQLERVLAAGLLVVARADGGRPSADAEHLLRTLHTAAREHPTPPTADVGSEDPPHPIVELTVGEAAVRMGCRPRWVRTLAESGRLRGRLANPRLWLLDADSVDEYRFRRTSGKPRPEAEQS